MTRASSRIVAPALLTVIVLAVSACGGGSGEALDRAEFTARANTACESLRAASDTLETAEGDAVTGDALAERVNAAADGLEEFATKLDEPEPPEVIADGVDDLVSGVEQYADLLRELAEREDGQDYQALLQANSETVARLNDISTETTSLIAELQFGGCFPQVP